ncbi:MAG: glycerol-3-phosphate 1-O-acyltransferase PlsY [Zoogloeaceae bacterium]|jgi:glycerol-3-phosphate acyltransferase PlsY|nr:glycerol-3-phosphate 1-O-acyltransferase PlsY [Zoogloeaceae bacterium]
MLMPASPLFAILACLVAYLIGSVSFAVLGARLFRLADPRTYGSGNPGATNVLRSGNRKAAIFTLAGDTLKGVAVILLCRALGLAEWITGLVALAAFYGHIFPVFLKFRGGKGVATAGGALLALEFWTGIASLGAWIVTARVTRYSSLAAIVAGVSAPVFSILLHGADGQARVAFIMGATLVARHHANIRRLRAGTETRIGDKKET